MVYLKFHESRESRRIRAMKKNIKSISVDLFFYKKSKRRSCRPTSEISSKSYNAWSQKKIMECLGR